MYWSRGLLPNKYVFSVMISNFNPYSDKYIATDAYIDSKFCDSAGCESAIIVY